jgi:diguanylate cyclase (GGDEF)-like protein
LVLRNIELGSLLAYSGYWLVVLSEVLLNTNILALTSICILFALLQVIWTRNLCIKRTELEEELAEAFQDLKISRNENQFNIHENKLLSEFFQVEDHTKALSIILKRFSPNSAAELSGFVLLDENETILFKSRGMSNESKVSFRMDQSLIQDIKKREVVILKEKKLRSSEIFRSFSAKDRKKTRTIYLFDVSAESDQLAIFFTTTLYPAIGTIENQLNFASQILSFLAILLKRTMMNNESQKELKQTKEILELLSITDKHDISSMEMTKQFLDCLLNRLNAERISTYVSTSEIQNPVRPLVRTKHIIQAGFQDNWEEYEDELAILSSQFHKGMIIDSSTLRDCGIRSLIRSALTVPMIHKSTRIGEVVITRKDKHLFTDEEFELAEWAGKHLASTISRIINQATIAKEARVDQLTQLSNRREFDEEIVKSLNKAKENSHECALLFCDIDHFKKVNDTYGHQFGDDVLRGTAEIIKEEIKKIRSTDRAIMARYGGEEFALLLPGVSSPGAFRIANTIRHKIEGKNYRIGNEIINVTISIGTAIYPTQAANVKDLISNADSAVYQAKDEGRNRVVQISNSQSFENRTSFR